MSIPFSAPEPPGLSGPLAFIPGLRLSELLYREAVAPILAAEFPGLPYAAAHLFSGSEVLGFDTEISTDHHWGPRLSIFLSEADYAAHAEAIHELLRRRLPARIHGYSTNFGPPDEIGVRLPVPVDQGPIEHEVRILTVAALYHWLGVDPSDEIGPLDWLTFPEQALLEVTAGAVYRDDSGELTAARERFRYYPRDVWLCRMAAQWLRVSQEEAFVGRAGHVGDELGSRIVAARIVRDLMRLCFLIERVYAPYSKWLGSAFARLACVRGAELAPVFEQALAAPTWQERERHLGRAYETIAALHNKLNITEQLETPVRSYYERPYQTLRADRFAKAIRAAIRDDALRGLPSVIGAVDQFADTTDVTTNRALLRRLRAAYQ